MFTYLAMIADEVERSKFERLYLDHRQRMYGEAIRILKEPFYAEDAVQQAFVKLISFLPQVDETNPTRTRGLLVTITRNCAIDIYRKRSRQTAASLDEMTLDLPDHSVPVEECCDGEQLIQAILSLPERYAAVLRLKYSQDLPDRQIAGLLSISEENVRKRIQRAKRKLEQILEERAVEAIG